MKEGKHAVIRLMIPASFPFQVGNAAGGRTGDDVRRGAVFRERH